MADKVIFSGQSKEILVISGVTEVDVRSDLYSEWKRWASEDNNLKYLSAFRTFGGDPTIPGQFAPQYFFLTNGWRIIVDNGDEVSFGVNLYTDELDSPFIVGLGSAVSLRNSDAVLVDKGIAESLDYNGAVHINPNIGTAGVTYPIGTIAMPVNNLPDALTIADSRGIEYIHTYGTVVVGVDVHNKIFHGGKITDVIVFQGVNVSGCTFLECILAGSYSGYIAAQTCQLNDGLIGLNGVFENCGIRGDLYFSSGADTSILDCSSMVPGNGQSPALFLNTDVNLSFRKYSGGLKVYDCQSGSSVTLEFFAGNCRILSGNTGGDIVVRGIAGFEDQSSGTTVNASNLLIPYNVASQHSLNVNTEITKNK